MMVEIVASFNFTISESCVISLFLQHVSILFQEKLFLGKNIVFFIKRLLWHTAKIFPIRTKGVLLLKMSLLSNCLLRSWVQKLLVILRRRIHRWMNYLTGIIAQEFLIRLLWHFVLGCWCPLIFIVHRSQILLLRCRISGHHFHWCFVYIWRHHILSILF